jgi:hypothetical protein
MGFQDTIIALEQSGLKRCNRCGETKPLEEFNLYAKRGQKRPYRLCRRCESEQHTELRAAGRFRGKDARGFERRLTKYPEKHAAVVYLARRRDELCQSLPHRER